MQLQSLKLQRPTVKEEIQLQETPCPFASTKAHTDGRTEGPTLVQKNIFFFSKEKRVNKKHSSKVSKGVIME